MNIRLVKATIRGIAALLVASGLTITPALAIEDNLHFSGTVTSAPCGLDPLTTDLSVDFDMIMEPDLYAYARTKGVPFTITLTDCDLSIASKASITFKGTESTELPGLLAVTGEAAGIAIGVETEDGIAVPFNKPTPEHVLNSGDNTFTLMAYIQGEPTHLRQETITPGNFTAVSTFMLAYP
ncbi:fimbrial protein [Enterobacter asburiae]|uniref:fimbrial protein n=1 Tax=Enterobacter asburiae TaxID=61645 RepID=UPI000649B4EE|nr:fimbrial protein [Enterobacter asburiae]CAE7086205.1 Fimbria A protein [Enterobacter cloacae]AKK99946.1 exotoxin [Enterobacter asburiae]ELP5720169.1 fimbrial protein [Enterobacter asburiae]MCU3441534.1 fimbrial protein [Enterobacter asburiae]CAE7482029.1 Fimbria A protein [Enterobacter cloacae]